MRTTEGVDETLEIDMEEILERQEAIGELKGKGEGREEGMIEGTKEGRTEGREVG